MKATGNLRVKRGIWQMVFEYKDATGKRRQRSETTGLPEKGNKRRAQQMLDKRLEELSQQRTATLEAKSVLFLPFMASWLDDVMAHKIRPNTLSQYKMILNGYLAKYEPFHGVKIQDVTPALIQSFYNAELNAGLSPNTVRKHHAKYPQVPGLCCPLGVYLQQSLGTDRASSKAEVYRSKNPDSGTDKGPLTYVPRRSAGGSGVSHGDLWAAPL